MAASATVVFAAPVINHFLGACAGEKTEEASRGLALSATEREIVSLLAEFGGPFAARLASVAMGGNFPPAIAAHAQGAIGDFLDSGDRDGLRLAWEAIFVPEEDDFSEVYEDD